MSGNPTGQAAFQRRLATVADIPAIVALMRASIAENMKAFLSADEIIAAQETMGLDQSLIRDQTYFVIETVQGGETVMVACGGWGKRRTLYGGDQTAGRDDSLADPAIHAARIRAMYTHPDWTIELGSTIAGEALYLARGYAPFHREEQVAANGQVKTVIHMRKAL